MRPKIVGGGLYFGSNNPACKETSVNISPTPQMDLQQGRKPALTIDNNLHAESLGCAPTPNQYFARAESSLMSLNGLPSPSVGGLGIGSYVPVSRPSVPCPQCPQSLYGPSSLLTPIAIHIYPVIERLTRTKDLNRLAIPCAPIPNISPGPRKPLHMGNWAKQTSPVQQQYCKTVPCDARSGLTLSSRPLCAVDVSCEGCDGVRELLKMWRCAEGANRAGRDSAASGGDVTEQVINKLGLQAKHQSY